MKHHSQARVAFIVAALGVASVIAAVADNVGDEHLTTLDNPSIFESPDAESPIVTAFEVASLPDQKHVNEFLPVIWTGEDCLDSETSTTGIDDHRLSGFSTGMWVRLRVVPVIHNVDLDIEVWDSTREVLIEWDDTSRSAAEVTFFLKPTDRLLVRIKSRRAAAYSICWAMWW